MEAIMNVQLKRLTENELELLMNWRMQPDITKMMLTDPVLTLEGQKKWFEKIKNDKSQIKWIIFSDNIPIGSAYLDNIDYENKRCEMGWLVSQKKHRSFKLTFSVLANICNFIFENLGLNKVHGTIIDDNKIILGFTKLCGGKQEGLLRRHVLKNGVYHDVILTGTLKEEWLAARENNEYEKIYIEN